MGSNPTESLVPANLKDAINAASELFEGHLHDWRLANTTLELLKTQSFESEELCLLKVVAIDALYGAGLQFHPGLREKLARDIFSRRKYFSDASTADCKVADGIAKVSGNKKGAGNISFASKFCHFFISDQYPIFDSLAKLALKKCQPDADVSSYPSFCESVKNLINDVDAKLNVRQLDQYLWLTGKFIQWKAKTEKKGKNGKVRMVSEVIQLFEAPSSNQVRKLLSRLTNGEYEQVANSKLPDNLSR